MPRAAKIALAIALPLLPVAAQAPQTRQDTPASTLADALTEACRQNAEQFARFLTAENAAVFQRLPAKQQVALLQRVVRLEDAGRPLLSNDAQGHTLVRCETPGVTIELRLGQTHQRENLAFIPMELIVPGESPGTIDAVERQIKIGMVREGSSWKLLSVGLLLLDLPTLVKQWERADLEAREKAAITALREIARAIQTYRNAFGKLPESLAQLGPAPKAGISPEAAGLLDGELAAGQKGGYSFRYRIVPAPGEGGEADRSKEAGFELAATPAEYGKTGRRSFFLDASGTLRGADKHGAVATLTDPRIDKP